MNDQEVWQHLLQEAKGRCEKLLKNIKECNIELGCALACIKVYESYGERHPCTYGAGMSVESQRERLHRLAMELELEKRKVQQIQTQLEPTFSISVGTQV